MTDKAPAAKSGDKKEGAEPSSDGARTAFTLEEATKVGFFGTEVDPTPDENYSLQTPLDAPTPETDPGAHDKAQKAVYGGGDAKFPGGNA